MKIQDPIHLASPKFRQSDIMGVVKVLESGHLVQGKNVNRLEKLYADFTENAFATAVANGTAALQLALVAAGIGHGDEVIVPAFSYVATANAVELVGARPVFVDIRPDTFNIDTSRIERAISNKTKAIIPVHEFGLCAEMDAIIHIADKYELTIIEDAACALGAELNGKHAGTFGGFGAFSLHPRKAITSGEGGILLTQSAEDCATIKALRNHGIDPGSKQMDFIMPGFNYRLTDFQAALVVGQFDRLSEFLQRKSDIANTYLEKVESPHFRLPQQEKGYKHAWQTFHLLCSNNTVRDALKDHLGKREIYTNYGAQCIPMMTYYKNTYGYQPMSFPNAYHAYTAGLAIPAHEGLTDKEVNRVVEGLNTFNT